MLLYQQERPLRKYVISHLESTDYRNKSLSNRILGSKREKVCAVCPYLLFWNDIVKIIKLKVKSVAQRLRRIKNDIVSYLKTHYSYIN